MPCNQELLSNLFAAEGNTITLDGSCIYTLTDGGNGYAFYDFWNRQGLVIEGNGATIARADGAPEKGILAFFYGQDVVVRNLTVRNGMATTNFGLGGGLWFFRTTGVVENVIAVDNQATAGGGIQVEHPSSHITIRNTVLANNRAEGGAGLQATGLVTIENSTIADTNNTPLQGVLVWQPATIRNSIVSGFQKGLMSGGAETVIREGHNAFAQNDADMEGLSGGTFVHEGGSDSYHAIRFMDPAGTDFRLQFTSPAIDKGAPTSLISDADGQPRPFDGGAVDAGAYEFQGTGGPALAIRRIQPAAVGVAQPFVVRLFVQNEGVATATSLRVEETIPAGATVVTNSISHSGIQTGGNLTWALASLAPGQGVVLSYQIQADVSIGGHGYQVVSEQNPVVVANGQAEAITMNSGVKAVQSFAPNPDGYTFANFGGGAEGDLSTEDVVTIFGLEQACKSQNPCRLTALMESWRLLWLKRLARGQSDGLSATALGHLLDPTLSPQAVRSSAYFANELDQTDVRHVVARYGALQGLTPANAEILAGQGVIVPVAMTPVTVLDLLLANLADAESEDRYWLQIAKSPEVRGGGWHSVVPYRVEQRNDDDYLVYVYDPNLPADAAEASHQIIEIRRSRNSWSYPNARTADRILYDYNGDASTANLRLVSWRWQNSLPKACGALCASDGNGGQETLEFHLDGEGFFMITRSDGRRAGLDLITGAPVDEIEGTAWLPVADGSGANTPPGLRIPHIDGMTYTVILASRDSALGADRIEASFTMIGAGSFVHLSNLKLSPPVVQARALDVPFDSLPVQIDPTQKSVQVRSTLRSGTMPGIALSIGSTEGADYRFAVEALSLGQGYSAALSFDPLSSRLVVENNDPADNTFTVAVERSTSAGATAQANIRTEDGSAVGAILELGDGWDGTSPPTVIPNTNPTLPGAERRLYLPLLTRQAD